MTSTPPASSNPSLSSPISLNEPNRLVQASASLGLAPIQSARFKMNQYWSRRTIPVAIAIGVVPVMLIGGFAYGTGQFLLRQQQSSSRPASDREAAEFYKQGQQGLLALLIGTGMTACITGGLAWLWLKLFVNALVRQSTQVTTQTDQSQVSGALQELGRTIGLLHEQSSPQALLDTAVGEIQSLFKVERVLIFFSGSGTIPPLRAESQAANQVRLLSQDLSHLPMSLETLFQVPVGYVQVCSEVEGSDLSPLHQSTLHELNVKAQMVTHITRDNQSVGVLVVQQSTTTRDWTAVEHQLFAVIAKQIGIVLGGQSIAPLSSTADSSAGFSTLWSDYQTYCHQVAESSVAKAQMVSKVVSQVQSLLDTSQSLGQGIKQSQDHLQSHSEILRIGDNAVTQSITSLSEMQATIAQTSHSAQQMANNVQQIAQATTQMKALADQLNYETMNASIAAKRQDTMPQSWHLDFTNQILQITRQVSRHSTELENLSTQTLSETQTLIQSVDTGAEQIVVSTEWFRDSRQKLNHLISVNAQLESLLMRLINTHQDLSEETEQAHQQMLELTQWINQLVENSGSMVQSIEQMTHRALA